ncbi:hypothetical protein ACET3X_004443 [Alternaria dauci]|uniref:Uncharacterized protein n=1 Tax=Alternaria dauci TaxID=48095 RepID=A0ABR3UNI0_9PLEO
MPPNHSLQPQTPPTGVVSRPLISRENNVTAPQREPAKPVTTLVSMLPQTTYNEADDAEGTVRSAAYIRVQLQLLKWLGSHASDTLTVGKAYNWTENIAEDKCPQARDALRLCYYMRSQGFDTYATFQESIMCLYIANQTTEVRDRKSDRLYWCQNFLNNDLAQVQRNVPVSSGARGGRRNAVSSDSNQPATQSLLASLNAVTAAGNGAARARSRNILAVTSGQNGQGEETGGGGGPASEDHAGQENGNGQPTVGSRPARIAAATAELESLLNSYPPNTVAIDAAIVRLAELNSEGN